MIKIIYCNAIALYSHVKDDIICQIIIFRITLFDMYRQFLTNVILYFVSSLRLINTYVSFLYRNQRRPVVSEYPICAKQFETKLHSCIPCICSPFRRFQMLLLLCSTWLQISFFNSLAKLSRFPALFSWLEPLWLLGYFWHAVVPFKAKLD